ncbi:MAG: hypothetical protein KDD82_08875, partial [Planctomycetes bacterium]|nr:hypothetical protein [Planctomycetota bacterium]
ILGFELTQPDEGAWGERVRSVLSLLVGFEVPPQERASLERMARRRLSATPASPDALELNEDGVESR